jgi:hypothetical protein
VWGLGAQGDLEIASAKAFTMSAALQLTPCDGCAATGTFPIVRTGPIGDECEWSFCPDCVRAFNAAYAGRRYQEIRLVKGDTDGSDVQTVRPDQT